MNVERTQLCSYYRAGKELMSIIYKELLQLNNEEKKNLKRKKKKTQVIWTVTEELVVVTFKIWYSKKIFWREISDNCPD